MKILLVILIIISLVSIGVLSINQITFSNTMRSVVNFITNIGDKIRDVSEIFGYDWYLVTVQDNSSLYGTYTFLINTKNRFNSDNDLIINKATIYTNYEYYDNIDNVQFLDGSINYGVFQFRGFLGSVSTLVTLNNARIRNIKPETAFEIIAQNTFTIYTLNGGYQ